MNATVLPLPGAATSTALAPAQIAKAWKAAQDFEAMALGQMLQPMFATVDTAHTVFGGGEGEAAWQPMLIDAIGKQLVARGGLGLAGPVFQEMLRMQEARGAATESAP